MVQKRSSEEHEKGISVQGEMVNVDDPSGGGASLTAHRLCLQLTTLPTVLGTPLHFISTTPILLLQHIMDLVASIRKEGSR